MYRRGDRLPGATGQHVRRIDGDAGHRCRQRDFGQQRLRHFRLWRVHPHRRQPDRLDASAPRRWATLAMASVSTSSGGDTIGGAAGAGNVISGNMANGVDLAGAGANGNAVAGNLIRHRHYRHRGDRQRHGRRRARSRHTGNTIGGLTATPGTGAGNVISGNDGPVSATAAGRPHRRQLDRHRRRRHRGPGQHQRRRFCLPERRHDRRHVGWGGQRHLRQHSDGVEITGTGTTGNLVAGNLHRHRRHRHRPPSPTAPTAWRSTPAARTTRLAARRRRRRRQRHLRQHGDGVEIDVSGTSDNVVAGNLIGTDMTGEHALGNTDDGIYLANTTGNTIGGPTAASRNVIAADGLRGIELDSANSEPGRGQLHRHRRHGQHGHGGRSQWDL